MPEAIYEYATKAWPVANGCSEALPCAARCWAKRTVNRLAHSPNAKVRSAHEDLVTSRRLPLQSGAPNLAWTGTVRLNEAHLLDPLKWRKPQRVAVAYHGDLFHPALSDEARDRVFAVTSQSPQHQFLTLTKRAREMREYWERKRGHFAFEYQQAPAKSVSRLLPFENVHLGISASTQAEADERIPELLATPAAVRWVSLEPLTGPVVLKPEWLSHYWNPISGALPKPLDWVVVGGESGPSARPMHPDWVRSLRDQCAAASVPYWFKQWGAWAPKANFANFAEWNQASAHALVMQDGSFTAVTGRDEPDEEFGLTCADLDGNDYAASMALVGARAAGNLLDGRQWQQFPEATHA